MLGRDRRLRAAGRLGPRLAERLGRAPGRLGERPPRARPGQPGQRPGGGGARLAGGLLRGGERQEPLAGRLELRPPELQLPQRGERRQLARLAEPGQQGHVRAGPPPLPRQPGRQRSPAGVAAPRRHRAEGAQDLGGRGEVHQGLHRRRGQRAEPLRGRGQGVGGRGVGQAPQGLRRGQRHLAVLRLEQVLQAGLHPREPGGAQPPRRGRRERAARLGRAVQERVEPLHRLRPAARAQLLGRAGAGRAGGRLDRSGHPLPALPGLGLDRLAQRHAEPVERLGDGRAPGVAGARRSRPPAGPRRRRPDRAPPGRWPPPRPPPASGSWSMAPRPSAARGPPTAVKASAAARRTAPLGSPWATSRAGRARAPSARPSARTAAARRVGSADSSSPRPQPAASPASRRVRAAARRRLGSNTRRMLPDPSRRRKAQVGGCTVERPWRSLSGPGAAVRRRAEAGPPACARRGRGAPGARCGHRRGRGHGRRSADPSPALAPEAGRPWRSVLPGPPLRSRSVPGAVLGPTCRSTRASPGRASPRRRPARALRAPAGPSHRSTRASPGPACRDRRAARAPPAPSDHAPAGRAFRTGPGAPPGPPPPPPAARRASGRPAGPSRPAPATAGRGRGAAPPWGAPGATVSADRLATPPMPPRRRAPPRARRG